ncbi:SDR family oxidoreductase [Novosphingobium terrae]|uniref:SDR family oxidoreductase n=1 Tax=Novosphingobium terrae TaxID=2726189 RepID=UPI001981EBD6|nr:SDR family oxidoreductase [Novosphingobium terrae]
MRVFVTGASGWVGASVVRDLRAHGHEVLGLARSDQGETIAREAGAQVLRGTLDDLELLQQAARDSDGVIHTAFNHDFTRFAENAAQDRRAIEAIGAALEGSERMLLVTSGLAGMVAPGQLADEDDRPSGDFPRYSESAAQALAARGVRAGTVRLAPSVHGLGDHGFVPILIGIARSTGISAYVGEGANRWAGVHRLDAAPVYRLALEKGLPLPVYHATADEGVPFKAIAEVIGRQLGLPVESREPEHFGWFARFAGAEIGATSVRTREALGWAPTQPGLLSDLDQPGYYAA